MPKFLLLAILGLVIYLFFKRSARLGQSNSLHRRSASAANGPNDATQNATQQMVVCAHCGVYVPENESLPAETAHGQEAVYFCSEQHRRLGRKSG